MPLDYLDELIKAAMRQGEFDNLPGMGQPLELDDDPNTPEHLRLAHKLLRDQGMAPEWIEQSRALDERIAAWGKDVQRARLKREQGYAAADKTPYPMLNRVPVDEAWTAARTDLLRRGEQLNREILSYNLKVPKGVTHKLPLRLETALG